VPQIWPMADAAHCKWFYLLTCFNHSFIHVYMISYCRWGCMLWPGRVLWSLSERAWMQQHCLS